MALEKVQNIFQPSEKKIKQETRKNIRQIDREVRSLNREIKKNEAEERKITQNIRKAAEQGRNDKVRQLAKNVVRVRRHNEKLNMMVGSLGDVKFQLQQMSSMMAQQRAMKNVTKMMKKMNSRMSPAKFAKIMQKFQLEQQKAELNADLMEDALGEEDEELEDEIVDGILTEIGLQKLDGLNYTPVEAPATTVATTAPVRTAVAEGGGAEEAEKTGEMSALEERLNNLNNNNL